MLAVGILFVCLHAAGTLAAPPEYKTTPVPILKQINRHNDDGSYSYGYESADGSFKIETKYPNGEVYGKYGYVGDDGKVRQVEYGATKRGFEPVGSHINVAPPTLSNSVEDTNPDYDDGQYREDPTVYDQTTSLPLTKFSKTGFKTSFKTPANQPQKQQKTQQQQQSNYYQQLQRQQQVIEQQRQQLLLLQQQQQQQQAALFQHQQQQQQQRHGRFFQQPQQQQPLLNFVAPATHLQYFHHQPSFQPFRINYDPAIFNGHPATNIDINTGSYTVSYTS